MGGGFARRVTLLVCRVCKCDCFQPATPLNVRAPVLFTWLLSVELISAFDGRWRAKGEEKWRRMFDAQILCGTSEGMVMVLYLNYRYNTLIVD